MKILLKTNIKDGGNSGDVVDMPDDEAQHLLDRDLAELVPSDETGTENVENTPPAADQDSDAGTQDQGGQEEKKNPNDQAQTETPGGESEASKDETSADDANLVDESKNPVDNGTPK